jgi:hypothetical protein
LVERKDLIVRKWFSEIRPPEAEQDGPRRDLLVYFLETLVLILPHCIGNGRDREAGLWEQASHLYGALALQRSLAAGEVVEELQRLRSVLLRLLLESPPWTGLSKESLKDLHALNRSLDAAVVSACVAYTDDLFFAHLQGSGVPEDITTEVQEEMRTRLDSFRRRVAGN